MADGVWKVVQEEESYDEAENHVGVFMIEYSGPGRPPLAIMAANVNTKLRELGIMPHNVISINAVLSQKTREVWYSKDSSGD